MGYQETVMTDSELLRVFAIEENHFNDFKAKDISGKKFSKIISAFANASGGDAYIGIREERETKVKRWEGFESIEDANSFIQVLDSTQNVESFYEVDFLKHPTLNTYVLKVSIFKTNTIVYTTDQKFLYAKVHKVCL